MSQDHNAVPAQEMLPCLRYAIRQQDDSIVEMTIADTFENRLFVAWVKSYEAAQDQFNGLVPGEPA